MNTTTYKYEAKNVRKTILKRFSPFDNTGIDLRECNSYEEAIQKAELDFEIEKNEIIHKVDLTDKKYLEIIDSEIKELQKYE
ncbi:MAG: hypothetical protein LBQ40_02105 [Clostridiales bacterium]|jgi:hypothetical protein|nr:hypothetical protein [Clostridiales bacterium]